MKFINRTRDLVVADRARAADNMISRMVGLLGSRGLDDGEGLWIVPCNSIHTFFMRFPIDVAFLDSQGKVLFTLGDLKPWRLSRIVWGARSVLELPAGKLAETRTQLGDTLEREE